MSIDLAKFVLEARIAANGGLTGQKKDVAQKKLMAIAIDPLLVSLDLDNARALRTSNDGAIFDYLLGKMTLAQLKKASKKWNPHRAPIQREMGMTDLRKELIRLLDGEAPATKPVRAPRPARARAS